jgi:hypothetical protein
MVCCSHSFLGSQGAGGVVHVRGLLVNVALARWFRIQVAAFWASLSETFSRPEVPIKIKYEILVFEKKRKHT